MNQKVIGQYIMGNMYVELVLREGTGGEIYPTPEPGHIPRIKVGADYDDWNEVVRILLHECIELISQEKGCRYEPSLDLGNDRSAYLFIFTHPQFSDVCGRLAELLVHALPDLSAAWYLWKHPKKRKRKKEIVYGGKRKK